jgi:hypothetical protein
MIKNIILISLFLAYSLISSGQDHDRVVKNLWVIESGYQNFRILDRNVSPLIYVANNGMLSCLYQKTKTKTIMDIGGSVSIGSNQSKRFGRRTAIVYDPYDINDHRDSSVYTVNPGLSFIQASLFYSYYGKLNTNKSKMYVGGIIQDNFYYGALGADTWFFNQFSIMPSYRIEYSYKHKSRFETEFSIPVCSYLLRLPYTNDPSLPENSYFKAYLKTGSFISTINKFQQVNLRFSYHYSLEKGGQIGLSYYFMWMNDKNMPERNLKAYSNSILISYSF